VVVYPEAFAMLKRYRAPSGVAYPIWRGPVGLICFTIEPAPPSVAERLPARIVVGDRGRDVGELRTFDPHRHLKILIAPPASHERGRTVEPADR
jgi:hypothetical protein